MIRFYEKDRVTLDWVFLGHDSQLPHDLAKAIEQKLPELEKMAEADKAANDDAGPRPKRRRPPKKRSSA